MRLIGRNIDRREVVPKKVFHAAAHAATRSDDVSVMPQPQLFFSSTATKAEDGAVSIAFFNGNETCVAILRCSADAALNLIGNIAVCLVNGDDPKAKPDD